MNYRFTKVEFIGLGIVLFIGAFCLFNPFFGDQSFFLLGAEKLNNQGVLYRDFWDIKQPGIFFFYLIAGKFFGFTPFGVHLFELIIFLIYAILLLLFFKTIAVFKNTHLVALIPICAVGIYYINAGTFMQTQVEAIINIPLNLIIISNYLSIKKTGWQRFLLLFASGLLAGVVIQFKLFFVILLVSIYGVFIIYDLYNHSIAVILRNIGFVLLGLLTSLIPFLIYVYRYDLSNIVFQTFFVYPGRIVSDTSLIDTGRLLNSVKGFSRQMIALIISAIVGIIFRRRHLLVVCYLVWIISGSVVILLQMTSWLQYQFQLLITPIGIMSVFGIDVIWVELSRFILITKNTLISFGVKAIIIVMFLLPSAYIITGKFSRLLHFISKNGSFDTASYACFYDNENCVVNKNTRFLKQNGSIPGDIYVAGTPLNYQYSERGQATALNGWAPWLFLPEQWSELYSEIKNKKPAYIFIDNIFRDLFEQKGKSVMQLVNRNYVFDNQNENGVWYRIIKSAEE